MTLTAAIVVLVLLALALVAALTFVMSRPAKLRPHRRRSGRPAARIRFYRPRSGASSDARAPR